MAYWFRRSLSRGRTRIVQMMLQRREIRTPATVCCHWRLILYSFHSSAVGINSSQSVMNGSNVINICWIACCKGDCHSQGKTPNSLENSGSIFEFTNPVNPTVRAKKIHDFSHRIEMYKHLTSNVKVVHLPGMDSLLQTQIIYASSVNYRITQGLLLIEQFCLKILRSLISFRC